MMPRTRRTVFNVSEVIMSWSQLEVIRSMHQKGVAKMAENFQDIFQLENKAYGNP